MQTCWTVGYVIGEIPSNIMLTKIRPRYWLPALEVCGRSRFAVYQYTNFPKQLTWTILTFCTCKANSATQLYVIRFFVGEDKADIACNHRIDTDLCQVLPRVPFIPACSTSSALGTVRTNSPRDHASSTQAVQSPQCSLDILWLQSITSEALEALKVGNGKHQPPISLDVSIADSKNQALHCRRHHLSPNLYSHLCLPP